MSSELEQVVAELGRHLAWHADDGVRTILRDRLAPALATATEAPPRAAAVTRPGATSQPVAPPARATHALPAQAKAQAPAPVPARTVAAPGRTLDEIRRELGDCKRCKLCQGRTNLVFGVGNPKAELVFVGEGPGQDEDLQGIPFVGKAGQLLTKMIEAMQFTRDDVYICNVVKCRPPENRPPEADEIAACEPFLKAQLASLQPKVIVALGKFAAHTLLRETTPISRLRGQWRSYEGIELMPTFHPAYLLRDPTQKKLAWQDLQAVMSKFGKGPQ